MKLAAGKKQDNDPGKKDDTKVDGREWRIAKWFPDLDPNLVNTLRIFHFELMNFNSRINLISNRTERHADQVHFADSILGVKAIFEYTQDNDIFDIGSGNGLPGLIIAAMYPKKKVTLIEKDARKVEFMKHAISRMNLKNATPYQKRFEDLPARSIKCAVSRGFASIGKALLLSRHQFANNGLYFHFKSDSWVTEVVNIPTQICSFWDTKLVKDYELPENGGRLSVVVTKRLSN